MSIPKVSIGMPVYNGEKYLQRALDSLLSQSFTDFELILSDNASLDQTEAICSRYAALDSRIKYIRQPKNLGAWANFKFVLDEAVGEYFMWAACDDIRSPDFIQLNYEFLSKNPDFIASTCPNGFNDQEINSQVFEKFTLDDRDSFKRIRRFFEHCWASHAMFYCLTRTQPLLSCKMIGESFIASDWAIILYLTKQGRMNRCVNGWILFGTEGASKSLDAFKTFRNSFIELFIPLYKVSKITIKLTKNFPANKRGMILFILGKVNIKAVKIQFMLVLYKYFAFIRKKLCY